MYNIQNTSGRNVALMLERGGVVLKPAQYFDLDKHCTRKWIQANKDLQRLLVTHAIRLVHDSNQIVPKTTTKPITRYKTAVGQDRVASTKPVEVVDLSVHPDVEVDDFGRVHKPAAAESKKEDLTLVMQEAAKQAVETVTQAAIDTVQRAASIAANRAAVEAVANVMQTAEEDLVLPVREPEEKEERAEKFLEVPMPKPESFMKNRLKKIDKIKNRKGTMLTNKASSVSE